MFERFSGSARAAVIQAQEEARRLGHGRVGSPHLLLALLAPPPGAPGVDRTLAEHGVTREAVERELAVLLAGDSRAAGDDAEVLAALGIDVARIRQAVEASFGPGALDRALDAEESRPRNFLARLARRRAPLPPRDEVAVLRAAGRGPGGGHIRFSPGAKKALELSLREALRLGDAGIESDHLVLGLLRSGDGAAAVILSRLGVDLPQLRAGIEKRHPRSA